MPVEHPGEDAAVSTDKPVEPFAADTLEGVLDFLRGGTQQLGARHRHQGQRHHGRDQDRHGQRQRELAKQAADHIAHEQQRNEHRDQRDGERDDGETHLCGAVQRSLERPLALLDVATDVLDHHNGVVDDEARCNRQRHQRQIVEAEAKEIHGAEGADQRQRHREARNERCARATEKHEDHKHDQNNGKRQLKLHIAH